MENVVTGKNIYYNTTPEEWKEFIACIKQNGPFDVIIDGLNVAYLANNLLKTQQRKAKPCAFKVSIKRIKCSMIYRSKSNLIDLIIAGRCR